MPLSLNEDVAIYRKFLNYLEVIHVVPKAALVATIPPLIFYGRRFLGKSIYNFTRHGGTTTHRTYELISWCSGSACGLTYFYKKLEKEKRLFYNESDYKIPTSEREDEITNEIIEEHNTQELVKNRLNIPSSEDVFDYLCALEYSEKHAASLSSTLSVICQCSVIQLLTSQSTHRYFGSRSNIYKIARKYNRLSFCLRFVFCWLLPFYWLREYKQGWFMAKWYHDADKVHPHDGEVEILQTVDLTTLTPNINNSLMGHLPNKFTVKHNQALESQVSDVRESDQVPQICLSPVENQYITWQELVEKRKTSS